MRKVIKILSKLIFSLLLLAIILPLTLSVLLTMSGVQTRVVRYATGWATEFLETSVDIAAVDIGAFGRVQFRGVYVEDYQGNTLLFADKLDVDVRRIGIASKNLRFGAITLDGGELNLIQTPDSVLNIKQVIDRLTPKEPKRRGTKIFFGEIELSNFTFRLQRLEPRNPKYGVDYGDIELNSMSAQVESLIIENQNVSANIKRVSALEKSGFELHNMRSKFSLSLGRIGFDETIIEGGYSYIEMPHFEIKAPLWSAYKDFINKVDIVANVENSTILSDDIAYFAPALKNWGLELSELDAGVSGRVDDLSVDVTRALYGQSSELAVRMHATALPNIKRSRIEAEIVESITTPDDIEQLYFAIKGEELSESVSQMIEGLGELRYRGGFEGTIYNFIANFDASSALGVVRSTFKMDDMGEEGHILSGELATTDFNMSSILPDAQLGRVSLTTTLEGDINNIKESAIAYGELHKVEFRGAEYRNITYHAESNSGEASVEVVSPNEGFDFEVAAVLDLDEDNLGCDISLNIKDIDLKKLRVNERDSLSRVGANIEGSLRGSSIDNMTADVIVYEGEYAYNERVVSCQDISLHADSNEERKYFELTSDFVDINFHSKDSYKESFDFLRGIMRDYLPSLYQGHEGEELEISYDSGIDSDSGDYSILSLDIKNLHLLSDAFVEGLQVAYGSRADLMYNSGKRDFSLSVRSQFVELNSVLALDISLDAMSSTDSMSMQSSIKELLVGSRQAENVSLSAGAGADRVSIKAGYDDSRDNTSARLSALADVEYNPQRGRLATLRILPSEITQANQRWDIGADSIAISRDGVSIDRFRISNDDQELSINGLASRSERDTIRVDMRHFDLSILSSVTTALGYSVEGYTSGKVVASSALYNMRVEANILIDSVSVNSIESPPLRLLAEWDPSLNRADISLRDRVKRDTLLAGYYIPSEAKYFASLSVDSLNLALLDAPLKGVLNETKGYASARLTLEGLRRDTRLNGVVDIDDMSTRVGYTKVKYRAPQARMVVRDSEFVMEDVAVYDTLNNSGRLNLNLNLKQLSNISYGVRLSVDDILALNTTSRDNDLFYGKIFTSGVISIAGDKRGVNMDIVATTRRNSSFAMPLSNKANISTAEFIKFVTPQSMIDTTDVVAHRRLLFEAQRQRRERERGGNLNIDMALSVTPDVDFQLVIDPTVGDVIKGRGEGRLNLRVNPKSNIFDMYGDYTITEGSYLFTLRNIINKRFAINSGSTIQWSGDPTDANLNIEAVYKLKTSLQPLMQDESTRAVPVDCSIFLTGKLLRPDVEFDISLPTADPEQQVVVSNLLNDQEAISRQFFYLMLANSFIPESSSGAGSEFGVSTTAATGFELLTNQLSNWLSSSNYNVIIRYRPESELAGDEVDLGISHSLINNRLLIEVEGNYTSDSQTTVDDDADPTSNFTGEAYITWLIDRSGALRLKGFTQTIDRFDENQGLQETGVGIYYRESFNNFQDLRERIKARFSRRGVKIND